MHKIRNNNKSVCCKKMQLQWHWGNSYLCQVNVGTAPGDRRWHWGWQVGTCCQSLSPISNYTTVHHMDKNSHTLSSSSLSFVRTRIWLTLLLSKKLPSKYMYCILSKCKNSMYISDVLCNLFINQKEGMHGELYLVLTNRDQSLNVQT